jgi:hypothetical protein
MRWWGLLILVLSLTVATNRMIRCSALSNPSVPG